MGHTHKLGAQTASEDQHLHINSYENWNNPANMSSALGDVERFSEPMVTSV